MSETAILTIVTVLLGGGFGGAVYALLKVGPERRNLMVDSAQGAVIVQDSVLARLESENRRFVARLDAAEAELAKMDSLLARMRTLESENGSLRAENSQLRERVAHLESQLAALTP